jgi:hypothetical protein
LIPGQTGPSENWDLLEMVKVRACGLGGSGLDTTPPTLSLLPTLLSEGGRKVSSYKAPLQSPEQWRERKTGNGPMEPLSGMGLSGPPLCTCAEKNSQPLKLHLHFFCTWGPGSCWDELTSSIHFILTIICPFMVPTILPFSGLCSAPPYCCSHEDLLQLS